MVVIVIKNDNNTRIVELKDVVLKFIKERNWERYHRPKDIAISIAIEVSELLELFQWKTDDEIDKLLRNQKFKDSLKDEVADIMIYLLSLTINTNVDIAEAVFDKMKRNEERFPIEQFKE